MAKFEIAILDAEDNQVIASATVKNGNWQYVDDYMETDKMESVTINTINKTHYLLNPVKDYIQHYDWDKFHETGDLVETGKSWRIYNTLLEYLNCRIGNLSDYRVKRERTREFECILMSFQGYYSKINEECDYKFENDIKAKVIITMRV